MRRIPIPSALLALTFAGTCAAPADGAPPNAQKADERPDTCHRLHWTFPRFRPWQYAASGAATITGLVLESQLSTPASTWRSPLPFDVVARDALRAGTLEGEENAQKISDHLWTFTQYYTIAIDSLLVPLAFDRGNTEVAWQMSMINWQTIGVAFLLTRGAHFTAGRARPYQHGCSDEPGAPNPCQTTGPSFFSGHTSMSAAGAGLACAHHQALPLYGGGWADTAICVLLSASALTVGGLRVVGDKHWVSDVVIGGMIGGSVGYGLPWLLHYSSPDGAPLGAGFLPPNVALVPLFDDHTTGVGLTGLL